jgi:hypothetical protein
MNGKNEAATRLMREAAKRKYEKLGERHPYSGVGWGLAAVLLAEGVRPGTTIPEHRVGESDDDTLAWELTSCLHSPLVRFDPDTTTVADIARAVADEMYWSFARQPEPREHYDSYVSSPVVDFSQFEREVDDHLRKHKIRKRTKRFAEFVEKSWENVLTAIRAAVVKGLAENRTRVARKAEDTRMRELPPIERMIAHETRLSALWEAMVWASDAESEERTNHPRFVELRRIVRTRRETHLDRCRRNEQTADEIERSAATLDAETVLREGMSRRPNLAIFLPEEG